MSWRTDAIAAIGRGLCPNGHGRLEDGGWCGRCGHHGAWYWVEDGDMVVAKYAPPEEA